MKLLRHISLLSALLIYTSIVKTHGGANENGTAWELNLPEEAVQESTSLENKSEASLSGETDSDSSNEHIGPIHVLNDFYVVAPSGYASTQTTSASLFAEEIARTPIQIDVLNRDFMDDIAASDVNDALKYATNVKAGLDASAGDEQSYTVRGLKSNRPSKNWLFVNSCEGSGMAVEKWHDI